MAIILLLDKAQYIEGSVRLFRGDAWNLNARVVDRIGSVDVDKNLTGASVTAYFPNADTSATGDITATAVIVDAECGKIQIPVTDEVTPLIALATNGIQPFVVVEGLETPSDPFTAQLLNPDLEIVDRGFQSI